MRVGTVTFGQISAFLIVFFLGVPIPSQATVFFADGFEYASQEAFEAVWASSCPGSSLLMGPSTAYAANGIRSLRSVQNGGANSCFVDRSYTQTQTVFYRWNLRLAPEYDLETVCVPTGSCAGGNGSKQMYAKALGAGYGVFWHLEPNTHLIRLNVTHGGYSVICSSGPGMPVGPQPNEECLYRPNMASVPIVPGNTYCVEAELVRGTPGVADGVARIWINGTLTMEYTNVAFARSTEGSSGFNTVTHYSQAGYGTRYIDDLVIGNTRIGCGATPSSGDTVAPNAPSGLLVR